MLILWIAMLFLFSCSLKRHSSSSNFTKVKYVPHFKKSTSKTSWSYYWEKQLEKDSSAVLASTSNDLPIEIQKIDSTKFPLEEENDTVQLETLNEESKNDSISSEEIPAPPPPKVKKTKEEKLAEKIAIKEKLAEEKKQQKIDQENAKIEAIKQKIQAKKERKEYRANRGQRKLDKQREKREAKAEKEALKGKKKAGKLSKKKSRDKIKREKRAKRKKRKKNRKKREKRKKRKKREKKDKPPFVPVKEKYSMQVVFSKDKNSHRRSGEAPSGNYEDYFNTKGHFSVGVIWDYNAKPSITYSGGVLMASKGSFSYQNGASNYQLSGSYIDIPLSATYYLSSGRIQPYIGAGVVLNVNSPLSKSQFTSNQEGISYTITLRATTLNASGLLKAGVEYYLTDKLRIVGEWNYRTAFTPIMRNSDYSVPLKQYISTKGISFGIKFNINQHK